MEPCNKSHHGWCGKYNLLCEFYGGPYGSFAEKKLDVKHLPSDYPKNHYEVVWQEGKPLTKVDEHVYLK